MSNRLRSWILSNFWHDRKGHQEVSKRKVGRDNAARSALDHRHDWAAVVWYDGKQYVSPTLKLDVICRIGGGDGFAAGLIYGMLAGKQPEEALRLGWAHGALLTTFTGDVTMAKLPEVEALAAGGTARVQR